MSDVSRLPGPVADHWDWQRLAACNGLGTERFFHPDGERGVSRARRDAAAKTVCARCPVREPCARHALAVQEPYGVWGGLSEDDREQIMHRRGQATRAAS